MFIDREQDTKGFFVFDALISFNQETNLVEVKEVVYSLKHFFFDGGTSWLAKQENSLQVFAFKTREERSFFINSENFASRAEWFKALVPYSFEPLRWSVDLKVYLERLGVSLDA